MSPAARGRSSARSLPAEQSTGTFPWFAAWTRQAACRGMYTVPPPGAANRSFSQERQELFFDYSNSATRIRAAKRVCASCQVRLECLRDNMEVAYGIFGGLTEVERYELLGQQGAGKVDRRAIRAYFIRLAANNTGG